MGRGVGGNKRDHAAEVVVVAYAVIYGHCVSPQRKVTQPVLFQIPVSMTS